MVGILLFVFTACDENIIKSQPDGLYALVSTDKGKVFISLYYKQVPLTVMNFIGLTEKVLVTGKKFYDGLTFHRVVEGFVIQGGDPSGDGTGGPGYQFPDEINPSLHHDREGVISMANSGPNTNGSQFFITLAPAPWLDGIHAIFGQVVHGMDVVRAIQKGDVIQSVRILRKGKEAKEFTVTPQLFEEAKQRVLQLQEEKKARDRLEKEAYIKQNWPGALALRDGRYVLVNREGTGRYPQRGQTVVVHYVGKFLDGKIFDSSRARNTAFEFQVGTSAVIEGWDRTVLEMREGEIRTVLIPPELAYGDRGAGGVIPPGAFLQFEIELISIK